MPRWRNKVDASDLGSDGFQARAGSSPALGTKISVKYTKLGRSDLMVSRLCIGCWQAGKFGWGDVKDDQIISGIQKAQELGINFIDTADIYGFGYSETLIGKAVKGKRTQFVIATKVGLSWPREKPNPTQTDIKRDLSPKYVKKAVEESLKRLGTDYIDLYQAHWPDPKIKLEDLAEVMEKICEEGKSRWWGISNFSLEEAKKLIQFRCKFFTSNQLPFNLLEREIEKDIPEYKERKIGILAYSPLGMGILTGKYKEPPEFNGFDWRQNYEFFREEKFYKVKRAIEQTEHIAKEKNAKFSQIAIAYILKKDIDVVIFGFKNADQVEENAKSVYIDLSEEEIKELESAFSF